MDADPNVYRTPLARARGLGSAKEGVNRFIGERVTGMALAPLSLWAVWAGFKIAAGGFEGAAELLASPINAVAAVLLVAFSAVHMEMGMRVIVEDYVHKPGNKIALLLLNAAFCWLVGALGVFSILKIALLGAGA
jgi:succinate dehydrogenase / fumarate reductase membrane anchor subunit